MEVYYADNPALGIRLKKGNILPPIRRPFLLQEARTQSSVLHQDLAP
jgi:hypothetical protein